MALKHKKNTAQKIRTGVQIAFFIFVLFLVSRSELAKLGITFPALSSISLHAICPFGGVVSFWNLATLGVLVKKVHSSSVVLAIAAIVISALFGPAICGWVCPFGSLQEWLGKLGKKIFGKRFNAFVPEKLDRILRFLRYFVLVWVSYMTIMTGKLAFEAVDPYYALFNFWKSEVSVTGLIALGVVVLLSLFVERPFCKYFCPFGAFQGIFNKFRIFSVKRNPSTCISCKACDKACPMNIKVSTSGSVRDTQCISCLKCTSEAACPVANTVELAAGDFQNAQTAQKQI